MSKNISHLAGARRRVDSYMPTSFARHDIEQQPQPTTGDDTASGGVIHFDADGNRIPSPAYMPRAWDQIAEAFQELTTAGRP
jgi:hypothetical protein